MVPEKNRPNRSSNYNLKNTDMETLECFGAKHSHALYRLNQIADKNSVEILVIFFIHFTTEVWIVVWIIITKTPLKCLVRVCVVV